MPDTTTPDETGTGGAAPDTKARSALPRPARRYAVRVMATAGSWLRRSGTGAVIGLLVALLGFAFVVQVRSNTSDAELAAARPDDLVRILSDLDARQERLRQEIADLEDRRRQLDSGAQGREAALEEAKRRADELGILAGTLPAQGPGLTIRFIAGGEPIRAASLLDAVEELRSAGAEAMQILGGNHTAVRVVASTYFTDSDDNVVVDGVTMKAPYTIEVIGDPKTMEPALNIPGGVVDALRPKSGTVSISESDSILVSTLRRNEPLRYARPTS